MSYYFLGEDEFLQKLSDPLYLDIIASDAFKRLKKIRFLGAIDYLIHPNGRRTSRRHNRFEHTLGVAGLALHYSKTLKLPLKTEKIIVCSALLHDIGHAPFSHSSEAGFSQLFGLNHHAVGDLIIKGKAKIGKAIPAILARHGVDLAELISVVDGESKAYFKEVFNGPINIDTIEGIYRSYTYISDQVNKPSRESILEAVIAISQGSNLAATQRLDTFWDMKDQVYTNLIQCHASLIADDAIAQYIITNKNKFDADSYFFTDEEFFKKYPDLKTELDNLRNLRLPENKKAISFTRRRFFVDSSVILLSTEDLKQRYKQRKIKQTIHI